MLSLAELIALRNQFSSTVNNLLSFPHDMATIRLINGQLESELREIGKQHGGSEEKCCRVLLRNIIDAAMRSLCDVDQFDLLN